MCLPLHYTIHNRSSLQQRCAKKLSTINLLCQIRKGGPGDANLLKMVTTDKYQSQDVNSDHSNSKVSLMLFNAVLFLKEKITRITV